MITSVVHLKDQKSLLNNCVTIWFDVDRFRVAYDKKTISQEDALELAEEYILHMEKFL